VSQGNGISAFDADDNSLSRKIIIERDAKPLSNH
jgi:hypothetical protein